MKIKEHLAAFNIDIEADIVAKFGWTLTMCRPSPVKTDGVLPSSAQCTPSCESWTCAVSVGFPSIFSTITKNIASSAQPTS